VPRLRRDSRGSDHRSLRRAPPPEVQRIGLSSRKSQFSEGRPVVMIAGRPGGRPAPTSSCRARWRIRHAAARPRARGIRPCRVRLDYWGQLDNHPLRAFAGRASGRLDRHMEGEVAPRQRRPRNDLGWGDLAVICKAKSPHTSATRHRPLARYPHRRGKRRSAGGEDSPGGVKRPKHGRRRQPRRVNRRSAGDGDSRGGSTAEARAAKTAAADQPPDPGGRPGPSPLRPARPCPAAARGRAAPRR
jgi:hypothetical protein